MDREAFKKRMQSLKSYRELNPDKGYWDWKVQAFDGGGYVAIPAIGLIHYLQNKLFESEDLSKKKKYYDFNKLIEVNNSDTGGYKTPNLDAYRNYDPTMRFSPETLMFDNEASGEENLYWATYNGLGKYIPDMDSKSATPWDQDVERRKKENKEPTSDFFGTTPRMDLNIQALADSTNLGKIYRNYDKYSAEYKDLPPKSTIKKAYELAKIILENPNIYHSIDADEIILKKNPDFEETNEINPLGMLAKFGLLWDDKKKTLRIHDTYDFPNWVINTSLISERPKEMKIRSNIEFDPQKGSKLLRDTANYNSQYPPLYKTFTNENQTSSYENGGETGELSKEDEQRLSNAIIHSIRKDNMDVVKSLMQRGSDEYIPIPHPQPGIASLVGDPTMLPYLDTASDMYNLAQSVYEKDPAGTAINTLALTLPYATSKAINKITRPIPTVKGYKESVEAQMNAVLARLKADLAKQAEWDNMVFRSAERVYDQDVIDRAIETGTVDRLNQVKDLYENSLENLPKVRMADNLPNGERGRIQLTPEAEARHKAGISPEDKDFEILVDRSIDPNQEIIDHEFRHFNQYMEKGSPDINTTATSTRSGVKPSKRNKLDPARSTYFGKEGESEAYLKNIYEDMKNNGFDPNNYSDFKKYLKGLSDRDSKKKAVAQFRSNIDAFKFMKKMPLIAATGVGLTAMNQNKEQSN